MNQWAKTIFRKSILCVPALVLVFVCSFSYAQPNMRQILLMRLKPGSSIAKVAQDYGLYVLDSVPNRGVYEVSVLRLGSEYLTQQYLSIDSRVQYCEEETCIISSELTATPFHISFDVSADASSYVSQAAYSLVHLASSNTPKILAPLAILPSRVTVAVLDTGVDLIHTALAGRLVVGYNALNP